MNAKQAGCAVAAMLILAGCASTRVAEQDPLNERSDRLAHLEDHRPPNPNRPNDNRELKAVPTVVQADPALDKASRDRGDKGLAVNAGPDQHVRPQDPTQSENSEKAAGGSAAQTQIGASNSVDSSLAARVRDSISTARKGDANINPALASKDSNGENKTIPNLEVTAKNGVVTISGSVASEAERAGLEQAASRTQGVTSVNNYLTVPKANKQ